MSNKENFTFGLKNFRNYDAEGAEFVMAPITILTGCNSAGKSSLVKALMLMNNCFSSVCEKYHATNKVDYKQYKLNFVDRQFNVGRYDIALNNKAGKDDLMSFSYKIVSPVINEEITVTYYFGPESADILNNGWLKKLTIANKNQEPIYALDLINNSCEINGNLLKDSFSKAMTYWALVSPIYAEEITWGMYVDCPKEAVDKSKELAKQLKLKCEDSDIAWLNSLTKNKPFQHFFDPQKELYMYKAVKELNESGTMFYMPVFEVTKGLSKEESVKYLRDFLADARKNWKPSENLKIYNHIDCGLDKLIADFERLAADFIKSDYASLLDFFLEYEQEMLFFVDDHITKGDNGKTTLHDILIVQHIGDMVYNALDMTTLRIGQEANVPNYWDSAIWEESRCVLNEVNLSEKDNNEDRGEDTTDTPKFVDYYSVLAAISTLLDKEESPLVEDKNDIGGMPKFIHPLYYSYFSDYVKSFLHSVLPDEGMDMSYVGSSRVKVNRLYALDNQSDEFASLLTKYFTQLKDYKGDYTPGSFMNKWVKEFGIGDRISINNTQEGLGVLIKLHSSESDTEGHLLADEGYGITQFVSILLQIEYSILSAEQVRKINSQQLNFYPFFVTDKDREQEYGPQTIAIEEPEIHLHPKYQSMLADMFLDAYKTYNIRFIVETHSEYLIRRFQVLVSDKQSGIDNSNIAIHYVENDETSKTNVRHIKVKEDGRLSEPFGHGFFDEADNLAFQLLENKAGNE